MFGVVAQQQSAGPTNRRSQGQHLPAPPEEETMPKTKRLVLHRDRFDNGYDTGGKGWYLRAWKNTRERVDGPRFGWSAEATEPDMGGRTVVLIEGGKTRSRVVDAAYAALRVLGIAR